MVVEFLGRHGEVLKRIAPPRLCVSVSIRDEVPDKEHFPENPGFPAWDFKRKISELPEAPVDVR